MDNSEPFISQHRIFVAIKPALNEEILHFISGCKKALKQSVVSWVQPDNIHLTLCFIGNVNNDELCTVNEIVKKISGKYQSFTLKINNFGYFGKPLPKVIWLGIDECHPLRAIYKNINTEVLKKGFNIDNKPFNPHLTIGRVKITSEVSLIQSLAVDFEKLSVYREKISEILIFESILKPSGPEYKILFKHSLI